MLVIVSKNLYKAARPLLTITKYSRRYIFMFVSCERILTLERRCWWSVSYVLTTSQPCSRSTSVTFLTLCFARTFILPSFKLRVSFVVNRPFLSYPVTIIQYCYKHRLTSGLEDGICLTGFCSLYWWLENVRQPPPAFRHIKP